MKLKHILWLSILLMSVGFFSWCVPTSTVQKEQITLVTSFAPLYAHTKTIVQDKAQIHNLVEIGKSVHNRQLTPQKAIEVEDADGIIINGVELEWFLSWYLSSMNDKVLDTSKGIALLKFTEEYEEHHHRIRDPHVWLNPENAIHQTKNILAGLQIVDPKNYSFYEKNAQQYIANIQALDKNIKDELQHISYKNFIVFHKAYGYFFDHYGLTMYQKSVIQDFEWESISIQDIQKFLKQIDEEDVKIIFTEPQFSPKVVTMLKEERPELVIQEINPIGNNLSANGYIETLELLSKNIIQAMK